MWTSRPLTMALCFLLFAAWMPPSASGQVRALQQRLADATSLSCTFAVRATGTWKGGIPAGEVAPATIEVAFSNINVDDGAADADGRFGASSVVVRYVHDYLHLVQMHNSGPLYTTTVLARETADGRLMAVHTRHEFTDVSLPGMTSRPEMYLGECVVGTELP